MRRKVVAVVGDSARSYRDRCTYVGDWIARSGHHLLTGGGGGVMEAVSLSFRECSGREGLTVGVIPGSVAAAGSHLRYSTKGSAYPNSAVDLAIYTHLPGLDPAGFDSRNHINVLSADLVIALPGGAGTHAEIQLARRYGKPVLLFLDETDQIGTETAPQLRSEGFAVVNRIADLVEQGNRVLVPERAAEPLVHLEFAGGVIRSWLWSDAESLKRHADNRNIARNLLEFPSPYTLRDARRWLAHALSASPETVFAVEVEGEAAGSIGLRLLGESRRGGAEVGYWLGKKFWGRGIGSRALETFSRFAFEHFAELRRIQAHVIAENRASRRVLEKAGYGLEGIMRQCAVRQDRLLDLCIYAILRQAGPR